MRDAKREIVEAVARGEMTPEEAAARLDELESAGRAAGQEPAGASATQAPPGPGAQPPPPGDGVQSVRVHCEVGSVEVIGDPGIRGAVADGPHVAEREAATLVVRSSIQNRRGGFVFTTRPGFRLSLGDAGRIRVRMNPHLPLEVDVQAGKLSVTGVEAPIRAGVQAGTAMIDGFRSTLDLVLQAGSVSAVGVLAGGQSRIKCEAGSVKLRLEPGSSVRVKARSSLGRVSLDGDEGDAFILGGGEREAVVGGGAGTLEIENSLGSVRVSAAR